MASATAGLIAAVIAAVGAGGCTHPSPPLQRAGAVAAEKSLCRSAQRTVRVPSRKYPTLRSAIRAAAPYTRIVVSPGQYRAGGGSWFALRLSTPGLCLWARPGRAVITAGRGQKYGVLLTADRVVVRGITLRGFEAAVALGRDDGTTQRDVTLDSVTVRGRTTGWSEGIVAYPDHRDTPQAPVLEGLTLRDVRVRNVSLGISCNAGPCVNWLLDGVTVRATGGDGESGADAFAIESGRSIEVRRSAFSGAGGDGVDTKASDVLISDTRVGPVARNAIKLWQGGEVRDTVVDGSGADAALVGDAGGVYRYLRVTVRNHDPGGSGYVGTWGYDSQQPIDLQIVSSSFENNASGGLYLSGAPGSRLWLQDNLFADEGGRLVEFGDVQIPASNRGLAELHSRGWGSGNRLR